MSKRKHKPTPKQRHPDQPSPPNHRPTHPRGDFQHPAPPEFTNRDHPAPAGSYSTAPGAGMISDETEPNTEAPGLPHHTQRLAHEPPAPQFAPGALRPGTTHASRPAAIPVQPDAPESPSSRPTEAASTGGTAPLSTPSETTGPSESAGPAAAETNDPNFSAAHMRRSISHEDAGRPRMDTSGRPEPATPLATHSRHPHLVRDVMTADVEVCNPETELYYVARMMMERDCGAIPVVDSTNTMRPVGILTDRDIVTRCIAKNANPLTERARDCMSTDLVTISADAPLADCVRQMERAQLRRILALDNTGRLCGIVAQADIVESTPDEHLAAELLKEVSEPQHHQTPPT